MGMAYGTRIASSLSGPKLSEAAKVAEKRTFESFEYLWRVEAVRYAQSDEYGDYRSSDPHLELFFLSVKKWTPTGARLWNGKHVDLRDGKKQFASRTPQEALKQFRMRKHAQIYILEKQLRRAKQELQLCQMETT